MSNPYLLTNAQKEYAMDLFARSKPLSFVIEKIAEDKGIRKAQLTTEIKQLLNKALITLNPSSKQCSEKNKKKYLNFNRITNVTENGLRST